MVAGWTDSFLQGQDGSFEYAYTISKLWVSRITCKHPIRSDSTTFNCQEKSKELRPIIANPLPFTLTRGHPYWFGSPWIMAYAFAFKLQQGFMMSY